MKKFFLLAFLLAWPSLLWAIAPAQYNGNLNNTIGSVIEFKRAKQPAAANDPNGATTFGVINTFLNSLTGELKDLIQRIQGRQTFSDRCDALLQDGNGQRLSYGALRARFDKARQEAAVDFQFRDIRAKSATDTGDLAHAQRLLGHKGRSMTERYTRDRKGDKVFPLK